MVHQDLDTTEKFPVVDSHIHLFPSSHLPNLSWTSDLPPDHRLNRQNSVNEYKHASSQQKNLRGFIFLETDRRSGLEDIDWQHPLEEVEFLTRIATGKPVDGEGHVREDQCLVLGIVPWAPIPAGPENLARYVEQVREHAQGSSGVWDLVKGFRYLLQDKKPGTMTEAKFIHAIQWLGNHNLSFDLGVDARSTGLHQLQEACEMMELVYNDKSQPRIIVNHFCKPNLRLEQSQTTSNNQDFSQWKTCIEKMASYRCTYMKLSGFFSELPPQTSTEPLEINDIIERIKPWTDVVFSAFKPERIMFGSDWPVVNVGGPGIETSWQYWHNVVKALLDTYNLSNEEKASIWAGTAIKAYNITKT